MDIGPAYRSLIGLPGGLNGPHGAAVVAANERVHNMTLVEGAGSDPDTIGLNTGECHERQSPMRVSIRVR